MTGGRAAVGGNPILEVAEEAVEGLTSNTRWRREWRAPDFISYRQHAALRHRPRGAWREGRGRGKQFVGDYSS